MNSHLMGNFQSEILTPSYSAEAYKRVCERLASSQSDNEDE